MATVTVKCPYCGSIEVIRYGKSRSSHQRYKCKHCAKVFQLDYRNRACQPGFHKQIIDMVMNSSGTRDTARTLGISKNQEYRYQGAEKDQRSCLMREY